MMRAALPFAFAVLLPGAGAADPAPPPQACALNEVASLDLAMDPGGAVEVPVTIDNHPVRFTIDTGALLSVVSDSIADELQLDRKSMPLELTLVGGVKTHELATTHSFTIGRITARDFGLAVMPASALVDFSSDGLLGPDVLSNYDVDFDFAHAKFNMFSPDHCPGKVVYWTKSGSYARIPFTLLDHLHIAAPVVIDGKTITALIDTGAERSMMSVAAAQALGPR
jgi:predicted aspartyl protease